MIGPAKEGAPGTVGGTLASSSYGATLRRFYNSFMHNGLKKKREPKSVRLFQYDTGRNPVFVSECYVRLG
jgi:hypothetical protein